MKIFSVDNLLLKNLPESNLNKKNLPLVFLALFLILNTLKITVFDVFITSSISVGLLLYKLIFTLVFVFAAYLIIIKIKFRFVIILFYIIQFVYLFANLAYYIYFHNYLHLMLSPVLFTESLNAVTHFSIPKDPRLLITILDLPVFIYLVYQYKKVRLISPALKIYRRLAIVSCLVVVLLAEGIGALNGESTSKLLKAYEDGGETKVVHRYGTLFNSVADAIKSQSGKNAASRLKYGNSVACNAQSSQKPNIVVIQVESMDANVINQKYNGKYIAPYLHSLSESNIYYPYTLSYHRAGGTSDCEFSIINSVEPLDDFPAMKIENYDFPNSIVNKLKNNSYNTFAFHGNVGSFFNRDMAFPKMGFKDYFDIDKMKLENKGWGAPDNELLDFAESKIKDEQKPFFNYIITMTSHGPFNNVLNYYKNDGYDKVDDDLVRNYFTSMSYVDQSIEKFITEVRASTPNTYFFIWGDHTPSIERDEYMQASVITDDKYFEYVPVIILTPDNKVYKETQSVASFLDIGPTILYASGVPFEIKTDGENLLDGINQGQPLIFKNARYDRKLLFKEISK